MESPNPIPNFREQRANQQKELMAAHIQALRSKGKPHAEAGPRQLISDDAAGAAVALYSAKRRTSRIEKMGASPLWQFADKQTLSTIPGIELREWHRNIPGHAISIHDGLKLMAARLQSSEGQRAEGSNTPTEGKRGQGDAPILTYKKRKAAYKALVWRLTEQQDLSSIPSIELREWRKFDLDHIISIHEGFKMGIAPEVIANLDNLRIITHKENALKGSRSDYGAHPMGALIASSVLAEC